MKKLNRLLTNSEKLMKNEELLNIRGGDMNPTCDDGLACFCTVYQGGPDYYYVGCFAAQQDCLQRCREIWG